MRAVMRSLSACRTRRVARLKRRTGLVAPERLPLGVAQLRPLLRAERLLADATARAARRGRLLVRRGDSLGSVGALSEAVEHAGALGFTDVIVRWQRDTAAERRREAVLELISYA